VRYVVVYSTPDCMFYQQVEAMLTEAGVTFRTINVPGRSAQEMMLAQYDARAFPLVLVEGVYVGGFPHVVRLHSQGLLRSIVEEAPVEPENTATRRRRLTSSADLSAKAPSSGTTPRAGETLADDAKLGASFDRTKKG
jgi:glutaredoxin